MVALMSHFPMKEQDFAHFSLFSFLLIVRLFLHNDLLSFQLARLFFLFFLTDLPLSRKKTQRGSPWHFSFFILSLCASSALIHLSLSFDASLAPLLDHLLLRCAVQSCSKSRVCSCWSSSIFLRLLASWRSLAFLSCRISQNRRKEDKVEDRRT